MLLVGGRKGKGKEYFTRVTPPFGVADLAMPAQRGTRRVFCRSRLAALQMYDSGLSSSLCSPRHACASTIAGS